MGLASAWAPLPGVGGGVVLSHLLSLQPLFLWEAFPALVRFPLRRAKISQVSWLGDEDNPPNGVLLSVSLSAQLCCD